VGLSVQDIAAIVGEIAPAVTGGWIQKIFQPAPRAILLEIRTPGQTLSLYVSADPETARLHLVTERYPNPATPPPFCQFLRAHIQGARIQQLEQVQSDRVVRLHLREREGPCSLIAELTGRRANLLLVDGNEGVLTALDMDREKPGTVYTPPSNRIGTHETAEPLWASSAGVDAPFPISAEIERRYRQREEELTTHRLRQARLGELKKRLKKAARRADALRSDLEKAARYQGHARYGELLKANLHLMRKGQDQLTVVDYFDDTLPELVIPLDPSKSPQGNMDDYFKKYRKHLAAEKEIRPRLEAEEQQIKALRTELADVERDGWSPPSTPLPVLRKVRSKTGHSPRQRSGPFRRFLSSDGLPIYVGRNAQENDLLTFGEARPDDLWLHAHGAPGSHVVVRLEKGAEPPVETIRDAAVLALLYSDLKKSGKGEVIYTRKKHVRKVKAQSPGTVTVTQEKTIFVTLDRARLDRLKERYAERKA
jgi:predicted ribosome quality control (RQC) complex YloA/Tae2 family protein